MKSLILGELLLLWYKKELEGMYGELRRISLMSM